MFNKNQKPSEFLKEWLKWNYLTLESQKILNKYYANFYNMYEYQWLHYNNRLLDVLNIIEDLKKELDILDYGSWTGTESLYFALLWANVFWVDYYEEDLLNIAIERKNILKNILKKELNVHFECKNLTEMSAHTKQYDIIWLNEAFHHIEPREQFLELIPRLLKKWWRIIISEPNAYNIINQLFFFKHRWFKTIGKMKWENWEEIIFWDERIIFPYNLRKELLKKWIECESERYFRIFPWNKSNKIINFLEKIFWKIKFLNIHYVYVWIKK